MFSVVTSTEHRTAEVNQLHIDLQIKLCTKCCPTANLIALTASVTGPRPPDFPPISHAFSAPVIGKEPHHHPEMKLQGE